MKMIRFFYWKFFNKGKEKNKKYNFWNITQRFIKQSDKSNNSFKSSIVSRLKGLKKFLLFLWDPNFGLNEKDGYGSIDDTDLDL